MLQVQYESGILCRIKNMR